MATSSSTTRTKRSGNPAKQAELTSVKEWKAKSKPAPLKLPSGFTALVKVPGLAVLISEGLISDSLTPIAEQAVQKGKGKEPKGMSDEEMAAMASDPKKIADAMDTFDKVLVYCVVQPHVTFYKYTQEDADDVTLEPRVTEEMVSKVIPEEDRDEDVLYSDEVDLEDKIFIFNVVSGGTKDLEKFRDEFGETVDRIHAVDSDEDSAE